tara:strand:- start:591 stop:719 length:129 start_codon:yes stop_codon:yes gene_type:complete
MFIGLKNLDQLDQADPGKEGTYFIGIFCLFNFTLNFVTVISI